MPSLKQIEANRLNAQKSTGPRSVEGKAAIRLNALKSGIDAQSQVIPGEDPKALAALTAEYHHRYQPTTPEVRALVDTLVTAEWMQRRFRTLEAQLLQVDIHGIYEEIEGLQVAQAYARGGATYDRLQRRINAVERTFHRALAALQKIESRGPQPTPLAPDPRPLAPDPRPLAPDPRPLAPDPRSLAPDPWPLAPDSPPDPKPRKPSDPEIGFVPPTPSLVMSPATPIREAPPVKDTSALLNPACEAAGKIGVSI